MKNKSIFYRSFIALTLLIAIPAIVITMILCFQVTRYSETEISKSAIGKLKVATNFSKTIAQNLYKDALNLNGTVNNMFGIITLKDIFKNPDDILKVYQLQNALTSMAGSNEILHSVYLFPTGSDFILTSNQGIQRIGDFVDKGWTKEYENFKKYKYGSAWIPTRSMMTSVRNEEERETAYKVITFFYNFTPYMTTIDGTLIFNVREEALSNLINNNSSITEGRIIIINPEGYVISDIDEELVGQKLNDDYIRDIRRTSIGEGYMIHTEGKERQLVTFYKSDFNDWTYVGIFPLDILMGKVQSLMLRTIYICLACLVIGTVAAYFVSKRLSNPLNKLVQDIKIRKGINIKSNDSETAILSSAFDQMLKEEDRLFSILEDSRENSRKVFIMNLLQGKPNEEWGFDQTGVEFSMVSFVCAVISIDKYKEFTNAYSGAQRDYMRTLILRVSEQLVGAAHRCAGIVYEKQKIVLVINLDPCPSNGVEVCLKEIFLKIQEELLKVFDNTISVGVGSIQESFAGVSESFDKAQEALKYKLINGFGSINFWRESYYGDTDYYYPYAIEKQIFNTVHSANPGRIKTAVSEMIKEIREKTDMQYENVVQIFNQLAVNIVKFLFDLHLNVSMVFGSNYNIYHDLSSKETLEDIETWMVKTYLTISDYLAVSRNQNKSYFDQALHYIHKNYKKDIDINLIADSVGLSYSHLRKIFKDETGDNIINYINNIRIDESKRLLCQTNLTIREIALNLGYNNEQSFVRFFKKYESISPREFRVSKKLLPWD